MQPLSVSGTSLTDNFPKSNNQPGTWRADSLGEAPMSQTQRATLSHLVQTLLLVSSLKPEEIWAAIYHQAGVKNEGELLSRHFLAAEQLLNQHIEQAEISHTCRQLLQQITSWFSVNNHRQAVESFIQQQFGHSALSALTPDQLRQVLLKLQNGQLSVPAPALHDPMEESLSPEQHQTITQQIARLALATGESAAKIWLSMLDVVNLEQGAPLPSRLFPLLADYLQTRLRLSQHKALTLALLFASLRQPPSPSEQQRLESAAQLQFQAQSHTLLTLAQGEILLYLLFNQRARWLKESRPIDSDEIIPYPTVIPMWTWLNSIVRPSITHPLFAIVTTFLMIFMVLWIIF